MASGPRPLSLSLRGRNLSILRRTGWHVDGTFQEMPGVSGVSAGGREVFIFFCVCVFVVFKQAFVCAVLTCFTRNTTMLGGDVVSSKNTF